MKKTLRLFVLMLSAFLLSGCLSNTPPSPEPLDKPSESSAAYQLLKEIAPLIGKTAQDIKATTFQRNTKNREKLSISGFEIKNTEVKAGSEKDPSIEIDKFFKSRTPGMENLADGPAESQLGYQRGKLYCLVHSIANASLDEVMSYEETEYPKDFSSTFTITCGEKEEKADSPTTDNEQEIIFDAWGVEPFWDFTLKGDQLSFNNAMMEEELKTTHTVNIQKEGENLIFSTENTLLGELKKEPCRDGGRGLMHDYSAKINIFNTDFEGCADAIPKYAEGDDFFSYKKIGSFDEFLEKTGLLKGDSKKYEKYEVQNIKGPYVILRIDDKDYNGITLVMKKTADGWEEVRHGDGIDYDSCKNAQARDPELWDWDLFQECEEDMARG